MNTKVGDWIVIPRIAKPVAINALCYYTRFSMALLCAGVGLVGNAPRLAYAVTDLPCACLTPRRTRTQSLI